MINKKYLHQAAHVLRLSLAAWLTISSLLFLFSDKLIYLTPFAKGNVRGKIQYEEVYLNGPQGKNYVIQSLNHKSNLVVLCLHGNKGTISQATDKIATKYNLIAPSYPGYHLSEGKPSEEAMHQSVDLSIEHLNKLGFENKNIIVFGASLGGNPALYAATKYPDLNRVILINTFDSVKSVCEDQYKIFCIFSGGLLNNIELAKSAKARIRQFHSNEDNVISLNQGENLFKFIASEDKTFQIIKGTHNDFPVLEIIDSSN